MNRPLKTYSAELRPTTHPDHHLWRNGRRWWVAFTYHTADGRKRRARLSLGTCDRDEARRLRDEVLEEFAREEGKSLSLRFVARASVESELGRGA